MEPIDLTSERREPARVLAPDLEPDVRCAAAVAVPVLISADLDVAEWLARLIHERSDRASEPFVVFRAGNGDQVRGLKQLLNGSGPGRGTLFVADVAGANKETQALLRDALAEPQPGPRTRFRVIGGTHQALFDLVVRGEFDETLFYRLNKIHILIRNRSAVARVKDDPTSDPPEKTVVRMLDLLAFRRHRAALRGGHAVRG